MYWCGAAHIMCSQATPAVLVAMQDRLMMAVTEVTMQVSQSMHHARHAKVARLTCDRA